MNMRKLSTKCLDQATRRPRWEYPSAKAAKADAGKFGAECGKVLAPQECDICGSWHLEPIGNRTATDGNCRCTGEDGKTKKAYQSKQVADKAAEERSQRVGMQLWPYRCGQGNGWHLTRSAPATP